MQILVGFAEGFISSIFAIRAWNTMSEARNMRLFREVLFWVLSTGKIWARPCPRFRVRLSQIVSCTCRRKSTDDDDDDMTDQWKTTWKAVRRRFSLWHIFPLDVVEKDAADFVEKVDAKIRQQEEEAREQLRRQEEESREQLRRQEE